MVPFLCIECETVDTHGPNRLANSTHRQVCHPACTARIEKLAIPGWWKSPCSIDSSRDKTSSRNRPTGPLLTPKAFDNKAQGRRGRGAPWVRHERKAPNPNGVEHASSGMNPRHAGHCLRDMAIQIVGPCWGPAHRLAFDPGCAAFAATLGFVVKPFHGDKHRCAALPVTPPSSRAIVLQPDHRTHTTLVQASLGKYSQRMVTKWKVDSAGGYRLS
jgi:hypothetical protein